MKENFDNLEYLLRELQDTILRFRFDFPEDLYKLLLDLLYHANNILKETEVLYSEQQELNCSRDSCNS